MCLSRGWCLASQLGVGDIRTLVETNTSLRHSLRLLEEENQSQGQVLRVSGTPQ